MPDVNVVLLPLCVGLALIGLIVTGIAWRRGRRGRVVQGVGLVLAPLALYFTGLLRLLWNGAVALGTWASSIILSPTIWFGFGLLGLCLVLWVVGGIIARRFPATPRTAKVTGGSTTGGGAKPGALPAAQTRAKQQRAAQPAAQDDDMAEIEALLKSRGIE